MHLDNWSLEIVYAWIQIKQISWFFLLAKKSNGIAVFVNGGHFEDGSDCSST